MAKYSSLLAAALRQASLADTEAVDERVVVSGGPASVAVVAVHVLMARTVSSGDEREVERAVRRRWEAKSAEVLDHDALARERRVLDGAVEVIWPVAAS